MKKIITLILIIIGLTSCEATTGTNISEGPPKYGSSEWIAQGHIPGSLPGTAPGTMPGKLFPGQT